MNDVEKGKLLDSLNASVANSNEEIRTNLNSPNVPLDEFNDEYNKWLDSVAAEESSLAGVDDKVAFWSYHHRNLMAPVSSLRSLSELMEYFRNSGPLSESDFSVTITSPISAPRSFCLVNLSLPELGVAYTPDGSKLTVQNPSIGVGVVSMGIVVPYSIAGRDIISILYKRQFNRDGTLAFIPNRDMPSVTINYSSNGVLPFVEFTGCKFSMPLARPNLAGTDKAVFTFNMSYFNYELK